MDTRYAKNIRLYFAYALLSSLVFDRAIFLVYLTDKGFTNAQIGILQAVLFFTSFALEIPTGIIGDSLGRKWSVIAGLFLLILHCAGMMACNSFAAFIALFFALGASFACISGADKSLLYDSLKECGREKDYLKVTSRVSTIGSFAMGCAMILGGFMKAVSWQFVYAATLCSALAAALCMFMMLEDRKASAPPEHGISFTALAATTRKLKLFFSLAAGKKLLWLFIAFSLFEAITTPFFIMNQKLLAHFNFSTAKIGMAFASIQFISGFSYLASVRIKAAFSYQKIALLTVLSTGLAILATHADTLYLSLLVFGYIAVVPEIFFVITEEHVQQQIPSRTRACVMSSWSFIQSFFISVSYLVIGQLMDTLGVVNALSIYGVLTLLPIALFIHYFRTQNSDGIMPQVKN